MNRPIVYSLSAVALLFVVSTAVQANVFSAPHNYDCENCHAVAVSTTNPGALGITNACLGCHNSSMPAARMPLSLSDMSNFFGRSPNDPASGSHSSHNWETTVNYPPAGAQEATIPLMRSTLLDGYVSCDKCHVVHWVDTPAYGKPLLRTPNTNDQLCLDCHRSRNYTTANGATTNYGTHPVMVVYSTVFKNRTAVFNRVPVATVTSNPTSNVGNYFKSGKVVCSTCHGAHYVDSNSGTFDNRSTANGMAPGALAESTGLLLRTDLRGENANSVNMCTNCHKFNKSYPDNVNLNEENPRRKKNHNKRNQNVLCSDCHGGHVDEADAYATKNTKLVNRVIKVSNQTKTVIFTSRSSNYTRTDGRGICQTCHIVPVGNNPATGESYPSQHAIPNANASVCSLCHPHSSGFSFTPNACSQCHGYPPGPNGQSGGSRAAGYTRDETTTPHMAHSGDVRGTSPSLYAYSCAQCHYLGIDESRHATNTYQDVFIDYSSSIANKYHPVGKRPTYATGSFTCTNVYCHSNGAPFVQGRYSTAYNAIPSWIGGAGTIIGKPTECRTCHGDGSNLTTNAHQRHVDVSGVNGRAYACRSCHALTVTPGNTISDKIKHTNGIKDVDFGNPAYSYNPVARTCTNICHTNGKGGAPADVAKWTDKTTGDCGSCHALRPATGSHFMHYTTQHGPRMDRSLNGTALDVCAQCHVYTTELNSTHVNLVVDRNAANCNACHPGTKIWGSTVTCQSCHTTSTLSVIYTHQAPYQNFTSFTKTGHGQPSYTASNTCNSCHDLQSVHVRRQGETTLPQANRLTLPILSTARVITWQANYCAHCHNNPTITTKGANFPSHATIYPSTGTQKGDMDCGVCHDPHGTTNIAMIRVSFNGQTVIFNNRSTGYISKVAVNGRYNGLCQVCHTRTSAFRNTTSHAASGPGAHYSDRDCMGCHPHVGGLIAFAPSGEGGCNGCHGYPPAASLTGIAVQNNYTGAKLNKYDGGGGVHTVSGHVKRTARPQEGWTNCSPCHPNANTHNKGGPTVKPSFVNISVPLTYRFNATKSFKYSGVQLDPTPGPSDWKNTTGTCTNVSCHFKPSPKWSTAR